VNIEAVNISATPVLPQVAEDADDPGSEIRLGLLIAGIFFILFLGWASFARLDAAAQAPGKLVVSGQRQTVQHREGGVIAAILVREGDQVQRGQVLIRLTGADVRAQERALSAQAIGLLAQRARLYAEQSGARTITPPPEFAELRPEDRAAAADALRSQLGQMRTRAAVLSAQRGAARRPWPAQRPGGQPGPGVQPPPDRHRRANPADR